MKITLDLKKVALVVVCLLPVLSSAETVIGYQPYYDDQYYFDQERPANTSYEDPRTQYRTYQEVFPGVVTIPTVISVPVPATTEAVLVYEPATGEYVGSMIQEERYIDANTYSVTMVNSSDGVRGDLAFLFDKKYPTSVDLLVTGQGDFAQTEFVLSTTGSVRTSDVTLSYALNSPAPDQITLYAIQADGSEELVAESSGGSGNMYRLVFPERYGQNWRIVFLYDESIRLSELEFGPVYSTSLPAAVRFLAQPNQNYWIYSDPEIVPYAVLRDSGYLSDVGVVSSARVGQILPNPLFRELDRDEDGVPDAIDNCPSDYNPDQLSTRGAGRGDVCDDFDNDGYVNAIDNCPDIPNTNQRDRDGDGTGDACDATESRLTEQFPWLPWVGMGITLIVILSLFVAVARRPLPTSTEDETTSGSGDPL